MWIEAVRRRTRSESLFVFNFSSIEEDFIPYVEQLEKVGICIENERSKERYLELVRKLRSRCDSQYSRNGVVASSCLFDDEMAELATHMSFLLLNINVDETE